MKKIICLIIVGTVFVACNKSSSKNITPIPNAPVLVNYYSFDLGSFHYSSPDVYGQPYTINSDTSVLQMNFYNNIDTVSGGFGLLISSNGIGTYTHTNIPTTGPFNGYGISVNYGNPSIPNSTYCSQSGTLTVTTFDNPNHTYAGTFSGIMYLTTNPSYTLALTNGSFYYKY